MNLEDLWAVWPDGTECSLLEKRDLAELLTWKSDDYEVKPAIGYDESLSPIFARGIDKLDGLAHPQATTPLPPCG